MPHGKFQSEILVNLNESISIIDLSGDFRLENKEIYEDFYGLKHNLKDVKNKFIYGLSEIYRDKIKIQSL